MQGSTDRQSAAEMQKWGSSRPLTLAGSRLAAHCIERQCSPIGTDSRDALAPQQVADNLISSLSSHPPTFPSPHLPPSPEPTSPPSPPWRHSANLLGQAECTACGHFVCYGSSCYCCVPRRAATDIYFTVNKCLQYFLITFTACFKQSLSNHNTCVILWHSDGIYLQANMSK